MSEPTSDDTDAATAAVRRYCGWHVAPAEVETVTLDGPGSPLLVLPTLHVVSISSIVENDVAVPMDFVKWSVDGRVRKTRNYPLDSSWFGAAPWGWWTGEFQGITVTMNHGYDDAPDFDKAVQMVAESMSASALRDDPSMTLKQVDDVRYGWSDSDVERIVGAHLLNPFRLEKQT
jgi:hypothetical protein